MYRHTREILKGLYVTASGAPTVNHDISADFFAGQRWLDASVSPADEYVCRSNALGAAVWQKVGNADTQVEAVTDGATLTVDAAKGVIKDVTIAGNRTVAAPLNPKDGAKLLFRITQGSGGSHTLTWNAAFLWTTSVPSPTLSTVAGKVDHIAFQYNAALAKWVAMGVNLA